MTVQQSTRHILMIEPSTFYANPETMETNAYQVTDEDHTHEELEAKALMEFRYFRDQLVMHGVYVTTVLGHKDCPDMVFPNWVTTHPEGMVIYPMLTPSRQAERRPALIDMLGRTYPVIADMSAAEQDGRALEAQGSIVYDRVNKVGYCGLSARTDEDLARYWAEHMGFELVVFNTESHNGKPVYHTDLVMHIGTSLATICADALVEAHRQRVIDKLLKTHEVLEISMEQLSRFCGNALEVQGVDNKRFLVMSSAAYGALHDEQREIISRHYDGGVIHAPLDTFETYGGGSARCMLMELV